MDNSTLVHSTLFKPARAAIDLLFPVHSPCQAECAAAFHVNGSQALPV